ncbi:hypothetical protein C8F04DRAFT_344160 [Mycena alexandri]|uniref:Uncharacterized protein n=1 Tax=Mycena alexandri TaxID=1745969 RepID=A0AAD6TGW1_9AGAR|nr:hypothetical protein C8F04DRAFT_344160 [Mycena alexandri]
MKESSPVIRTLTTTRTTSSTDQSQKAIQEKTGTGEPYNCADWDHIHPHGRDHFVDGLGAPEPEDDSKARKRKRLTVAVSAHPTEIKRVDQGAPGWKRVDQGAPGWKRVDQGAPGWKRVDQGAPGWKRVD